MTPAEATLPVRDEREPAGRRWIALDDRDARFLVSSGRAVLFAVREGASSRQQIGIVEVGGLLFGAEPSLLGDEKMMAVLDRGTVLQPVPPDAWTVAEARPVLAAGAAGWLAVLAEGVASSLGAAGGSAGPARRGRSSHDAGAILSGGSETVWLVLPSGGGLLFGVEPVAGLVPLPPGTFVTLDEGGEVDVLSSEEGFSRSDWLEGVVGFTQAVCELLPIARGFSETDEHHRLSLRGLAQERDRNSIAERLGGLIRRRRLEGVGADEKLPAVLRHFETEGGFRVRVPTRSKRAHMDVPPTLEEICRASDIRLQRAALRPGWWSREGGPFFAHRADGAPVALIWRRGAFREMDADGRAERVDAARAARIDPDVHIPFAILPAKNDAFELFKRSLYDGRGNVWGFLLSVVVASVIAQIAPITTGFIFGTLVPAAMDAAIVQVAAAVAVIGVVGFVVAVVGARTRLAMDAREDERLFRETWDKLLSLPLSTFRSSTTVDLTRQASGTVAYLSAARLFVSVAARSIGFGAGSLWVIAMGDGQTALIALFAALLHLAVTYGLARMQVQAILTGEALSGSSENQMLQIIAGLTTLRAAGAEARALAIWAHRFVAMRARLVKSRRVANLFEAWAVAFPVLSTAALFAALSASTGDALSGRTVASSMTMIVSFGVLMGTTGQFAGALARFVSQGPTWKLSRPLLDHPAQPLADLVDPGPISGEFEFSSVAFHYPSGQEVFQDVSFRVRPGEMVAIVGPSGGGKSTVIRLLLGLERPTGGAVYLDGHDVSTLHPAAMRQRIAVVTQNERLPPGTIFEIVRGQTSGGPAEVWEALAKAAMAEEVAAMPMGLHTMLQDAGRTLSGGQVQRIALARAFLAAPRLLILDEATSALDGETQGRVLDTILRSPATRFVIAHRLATVRQADRILVLDGGRIVESGGYDELIARGGTFATLAGA